MRWTFGHFGFFRRSPFDGWPVLACEPLIDPRDAAIALAVSDIVARIASLAEPSDSR